MGSDDHYLHILNKSFLFQFTLPCGERHWNSKNHFFVLQFQFTLPCGERQAISCSSSTSLKFQFTLPCGERHIIQVQICMSIRLFQFTLPCGERRLFFHHVFQKSFISIHAPVWGATFIVSSFKKDMIISIHAPVWGATSLENT